jgi:enoyl-CoA hydratase/carnithine racemase
VNAGDPTGERAGRVAPIGVTRHGDTVWVTLQRPERRNALSTEVLVALGEALETIASSDALAVVLAGHGPVFCAGHDLGELAEADLAAVRRMLETCQRVMLTLHEMPQVVVARVHGLATAAGCQLVAAADLAVASEEASFAVPGGRGGWFCTTPMVEVGRAVSRKRALELALTGEPIDASTALAWGLVNRVVPASELDDAVGEMVRLATRGSAAARAIGKPALYHQLGLPLVEAYKVATGVMADASQIPDARESMRAFVEKRPPQFGR